MVAAMSHDRVIGHRGRLPWGHGNMKHDQTRFRELVDGQIIAIGRGSFNPEDDYIKHAKHVYLLTSQPMVSADKITVCQKLRPIMEAAKTQDVFVVGGAKVFEEFISLADKLELTYIDADYAGDRFFPAFDETDWQVVKESSYPADTDNHHPYRFISLTRKN
jgi:dihydrofolate reductase